MENTRNSIKLFLHEARITAVKLQQVENALAVVEKSPASDGIRSVSSKSAVNEDY
jgi:hypothetical protein